MSIKSEWIRLFSTLIMLTALGMSSDAQILQSGRYESPALLKETAASFLVCPAGKQGMFAMHVLNAGTGRIFEVTLLDTLLKESWKGKISLGPNAVPVVSEAHNEILYILVRLQSGAGAFELITLDFKTREFHRYPIENYISFTPDFLLALDDGVMIGGTNNNHPLVIHFNLKTQLPKILTGFFDDAGELLQMDRADNETVNIITTFRNSEGYSSLALLRYDLEGNLLTNTEIDGSSGKNLIYGHTIKSRAGEQLVAGTYGKDSETSNGIFMATLDLDGTYKIRYYDYADLRHFFSYLKPNQEGKTNENTGQRKSENRQSKGNYRLLIHDIIPYGDHYVILGEAFYPLYTNPVIATANNSRKYRRNLPGSFRQHDEHFNGYQYTHAVVIGMSNDGKVLWDNSFELGEIATYRLDYYVRVLPAIDHLSLMYIYNEHIRSRVVQADGLAEEDLSESLRAINGDKIETELGASAVREWYPGNLFNYGMEIIHHTENGETATRRVFYINKITGN